MDTKKVLVFFILLSFGLGVSRSAVAFGESRRYLVNSSSGLVRHAVGSVRYDFGYGFTANLSPFQLKVARVLGGDAVELKPFHISSESKSSQSHTTSHLATIPGGAGVTVGVLDTGVTQHPDLDAHVSECRDFTLARPSLDSCADHNGHGTHVAGILVSQAADATLNIYKVCDDNGSCFPDDIAQAIAQARADGAQIITMSFGSDRNSRLVADAINASDAIIFIAAAGNGGPYPDSVEYPAALPSVISVGALGANGAIMDWSSRDADELAPGDHIESTWLDGGYQVLSGTSMAAPYVAGVRARMLSEHH